ncbi:MAG: hypothetical protein ACXVPU_09010 [Bacteroidia bacterium]
MFKKYFIILFVCFSSIISAQQEKVQFIHKHLVRTDASIVAGYMFKSDLSNVHIDGNLEYYLDNKVSIRGSASYMMGSSGLTKDSMGLHDFHSIYLGAVFHIPTKGYFDPYFILQPGIGYTSSFKATYKSTPSDYTKTATYPGVLSPIATAGFGFNYYFQHFAHLFMETRYVYGNHLSEAPHPISLQELRITFGLGFDLFIIKEKKKPA